MPNQPPFLLTVIALITVFYVAGCKSCAQPQPETAVIRTIEGHTVKSDGTPADDDGYRCFKRDDSRDLVLTLTAPEIRVGNPPLAFLIDILNGPVEDQPKIEVAKDGTATITYHGHAVDSNGITPRANIQHLGPGPYLVAAAIAQPMASAKRADLAGTQPLLLPYPYVTYINHKSECPIAGPLVSH